MELVERHGVLGEVASLLDRGGTGSGGVLVVTGPAGSGRTALADAAVEQARRRGFEVLRGTPVAGRARRWVWAQLVRDAGGSSELVAPLLAEPGDYDLDLDLDAAVVASCSSPRRLVVVDDLDRGGPDAVAVLAVLAGRAIAAPVAVLVTSRTPLAIGSEDGARARLLARLAHALLGDTGAAGRRRALVEDAMVLARCGRDRAVLAGRGARRAVARAVGSRRRTGPAGGRG